jgi:hypothetical protein
MIKKEIHYEDFDGKEVVENHWFHFSKSELIDMELSAEGGLSNKLSGVVKSNNGAEIMQLFKEIIGQAYGQRDPSNPTSFRKSKQISADFLASPAFDELLTELVTDMGAAVSFMNGLIPKDLEAMAAKVEKQNQNAPRVIENVDLSRGSIGIGAVQDPNKLDTGTGPWPNPDEAEKRNREKELSGLQYPYMVDGEIVPWAYRDPTNKELATMSQVQLRDIYRRREQGWEQPTGV